MGFAIDSKKIIIGVVLIIAIIALAFAFMIKPQLGNQSTNPIQGQNNPGQIFTQALPSELKECETAKFPVDCIRAKAVETKSTNPCNYLADFQSKELCFYKIAIESSNVELCANLKTITVADNCFEQIAVKTKNVSLCEKMQNKTPSITSSDSNNSLQSTVESDYELCKKFASSK